MGSEKHTFVEQLLIVQCSLRHQLLSLPFKGDTIGVSNWLCLFHLAFDASSVWSL